VVITPRCMGIKLTTYWWLHLAVWESNSQI
jgi:hypothetical protein